MSSTPDSNFVNPSRETTSDNSDEFAAGPAWQSACGQTETIAEVDGSMDSAASFQLDTVNTKTQSRRSEDLVSGSDRHEEAFVDELSSLLAEVRSAVMRHEPLIDRLEQVTLHRRQWDSHQQSLEQPMDALPSPLSETAIQLEQLQETLREQQQQLLDCQADLAETLEKANRLEEKATQWQQRAVDLQSLVEAAKDELEQLRSQRNVARAEVETLQRHWQQQNIEYERRLNNARSESEQLRRELESLQLGEQQTAKIQAVAAVEMQSGAESTNADDPTATVEIPVQPELDLRRVFTRIRDLC